MKQEEVPPSLLPSLDLSDITLLYILSVHADGSVALNMGSLESDHEQYQQEDVRPAATGEEGRGRKETMDANGWWSQDYSGARRRPPVHHTVLTREAP